MDRASTEEKFQHAVTLIKSLPKSGNFQPTNDLKLKFYSYFKQANDGPCDSPKPAFWDYISRAKWDAWNSLGSMGKEEAMEHYVEEFVKILKSQPFDDKAHDYAHIMGPFIDFAPKEFRDQYKEPNGNANTDAYEHNYDIKQHLNGHNLNGSVESDSEEFSDTFDQVNEDISEQESTAILKAAKGSNITEMRGGSEKRIGQSKDVNSPILGGSGGGGNHGYHGRGGGDSPHHYPSEYPGSSGNGGRKHNRNNSDDIPSDVSEQLAFAVIRLQHTMEQVVKRLDSLEALLQEKKSANYSNVSVSPNSFWSVFGIPLKTAIFIMGWPFLAHWLIYMIQKKRRR